MDAGASYDRQVILIFVVAAVSLLLAVGATVLAVQLGRQRSSLVIVEATITGFEAGAPTVVFRDDLGASHTVTLNRHGAKGEKVGTRVEVAFKAGQWTRPSDPPNPIPLYVGAVAMLLVGPSLIVHYERTQRRRALARAPVNRQPVGIQVRMVRSGRSGRKVALVSFPATGGASPDAEVQLSSFCLVREGRYAGEIAGDLRDGGVVVVWIAGWPQQVGGNLHRV